MASRNTEANTSVFRSVDWITIVLYLVLVMIGAVSIYAASYNFDQASLFDLKEFSGKQFLWIGISLVVGCVILLSDYRIFETYAYPIYGAVILLLVVTIFVASPINGSRSWIVLGTISIQPAEFGKFATALVLAKLFSSYNFRLNDKISNYLRALIIIFLPIILILMQRETGSALVYLSLVLVLYREGMSGLVLFSAIFAIFYFVIAVKFTEPMILGMPAGEFSCMVVIAVVLLLMVLFYCKDAVTAKYLFLGYLGSGVVLTVLSLLGVAVPGMPVMICLLLAAGIYVALAMLRHSVSRYLISIATMVVSLIFLFSVNYVFTSVLQEHQQKRIKVALAIEDDLMGAGYNVNQSKIAIGSGGLTGKGFLNGTQTKLNYVPEQHTDFIFCTIGEEEGFVGTTSVLLLFTALLLRLITIAERQKTVFSRVYAYCVISYLAFHLMINVGMVIGLCPVIGIPLPFFSYGGSALLSFTILLFILLRLDAARKE